VLATKLQFIEYVIKLFDQAFDLPCNTDFNGLVISCFNTMHKAKFLGAIFTRLFVDITIVAYHMAFLSKVMSDRHFHELGLNFEDWVGCIIILS
jgi:hypothetical protein